MHSNGLAFQHIQHIQGYIERIDHKMTGNNRDREGMGPSLHYVCITILNQLLHLHIRNFIF